MTPNKILAVLAVNWNCNWIILGINADTEVISNSSAQTAIVKHIYEGYVKRCLVALKI